jgi:hypothetical protein
VAVPDTGAYCSVFPLRIARRIGFTDADLVPQLPVTVVGGQDVDAFAPPEPVRAQIRVDAPGGSFFWGPTFALEVLFIDNEDSLLGRVDFFNTFNVVFSKNEPAMHIYYP